MENLINWTEVVKGIYVFHVTPKVWYEIHIEHQIMRDEVGNAKATLYIVGEWYSLTEHKNAFDREMIHKGTINECLKMIEEKREEFKR